MTKIVGLILNKFVDEEGFDEEEMHHVVSSKDDVFRGYIYT